MTTIYSGSPPESTIVSTVNNVTSTTTHTDHGSEIPSSPGTNYESITGTTEIPPNSLTSTGMPDITSKAGPVIIIGTETVTVTELTSPTTLTTIGHTFTIAPAAEGDHTMPYPTFVVIGSETATLPSVSEATTLVTLDSTFTILPPMVANSCTDRTAINKFNAIRDYKHLHQVAIAITDILVTDEFRIEFNGIYRGHYRDAHLASSIGIPRQHHHHEGPNHHFGFWRTPNHHNSRAIRRPILHWNILHWNILHWNILHCGLCHLHHMATQSPDNAR
uniref:Uncharacterized protein n=1 Tax=Colletotrichum fructicola (strain Nara gc5) TaxID=1213859 RepID=L2FPU8_COLFN